MGSIDFDWNSSSNSVIWENTPLDFEPSIFIVFVLCSAENARISSYYGNLELTWNFLFHEVVSIYGEISREDFN